MTGQFESDGLRLAYRTVGTGPPLVCHVGGPGFSSVAWGDLSRYTGGRTLVLLDPRGAGESEAPADTAAYSGEDYARDVDRLREHLGLDVIDLLGHSHGGVVAQTYAALYPERVRKLVLVSTLARFHDEQVEAMEAAMAARVGEPWYADAREALEQEQAGAFGSGEELMDLVRREMPFYFAQYGEREAAFVASLEAERMNVAALKHFNEEAFTTFDLRPLHGRITCPVLLVVGAEDFITGPRSSEEIAEGIAGSRLEVVAGAGHAIYVEQPEALWSAVHAFLDE